MVVPVARVLRDDPFLAVAVASVVQRIQVDMQTMALGEDLQG